MIDFSTLSPREVEVIEALIQHGYAKTAAPSLNMSVQTLKNHNMTILQKTGLSNMLQVCAMYAQQKAFSTWPKVERRTSPERRHYIRRAIDQQTNG